MGRWISLLIMALYPTFALASDTRNCDFKMRFDPDIGAKMTEVLYYLTRTSRNAAAACSRATIMHSLKGPGIASWSEKFATALQDKYEPNYPQSSEFPNHPKGFIMTGGDGFLRQYIYPKIPNEAAATFLNGSPSPCGEELLITKEPVFVLPTLNPDKGVRNAARHAGLSCVLASFCGFDAGKAVMDTHESMSPADGAEDSRCDQWNNDHGLRAGRQLHDWLVNKKQYRECSSSLDGIADNDMVPAFDLLGPPVYKAGAMGIFAADTDSQIRWIENNCQRAVESMIRGGLLCIDRPKPMEPATYRKPRGTLPVSAYGACTPVVTLPTGHFPISGAPEAR